MTSTVTTTSRNIPKLPIRFGDSVGPFRIGSNVNDIILYITSEMPNSPIEIIYPHHEHVLKEETVIVFVEYGLRLRFQAVSQRLYVIDVFDLSRVGALMNGSVFGGGPDMQSSFDALHKVLGASFPGRFIEDGVYFLGYDGVSFCFTLPADANSFGSASNTMNAMASSHSSAGEYVLNRVLVHPFDLDLDLEDPSRYPDIGPITARVHIQSKSTESCSRSSTTLYALSSVGSEYSPIRLGMCPQDVISVLGNPDIVAAYAYAANTQSLYRYEYRARGLELFFCPTTSSLQRITLHNNLPGSADFGRMSRCAFQIVHGDIVSDSIGAVPSLQEQSNHQHKLPSRPEDTSKSRSKNSSRTESSGAGDLTRKQSPPAAVSQTRDLSSMTPLSLSISATDASRCVCSPLTSAKFVPPPHMKAVEYTTSWDEAKSTLQHWLGTGVRAMPAALKAPAPGCPLPSTKLFGYPEISMVFEVSSGGVISSVSILTTFSDASPSPLS